MKNIIYILVLFFSLSSCKAQVVSKTEKIEQKKDDMMSYISLTKQAKRLYDDKKYGEAAIKYEEAFKALNGKAIWVHRYNLACSYALAGNSNKSFENLYELIEKFKYSRVNKIKTDKDLFSLHNDSRWSDVISEVEKNKIDKEQYLDKSLVAKLDTIFERDQKYRWKYGEVLKEFGENSSQMRELLRLNKESDSINQIEVRKILDTKGWLGKDVIGSKGNATLFLVVQHSGIDMQTKYLPMLKKAVKDGRANASNLALLEDRMLLKKGKKQKYGSQVKKDKKTGKYYVAPIEDPKNVDERRKKIGLNKLSEYLSKWDILWEK